MKNKNFRASIIIATIGNVSLFRVLDELSASSLRNDFLVIVSLPPDRNEFAEILDRYFKELKLSINHKILISPFKGQVAQRAFAIKNTNSKIIIQMDDDLYINNNVIANLLADIEHLGPGYAIGPQIKQNSSTENINPIKNIIYRYIYCRSNIDLQKGGILRFGISLYPSSFSGKFTAVEWLPGGCVCYHKSDALFDNYYPFSGKAYYEDVIASVLRSKMNIVHLINDGEVEIDPPEELNDFNKILSNISARNYMNALMGRNYFINIANYVDVMYYLYKKTKQLVFFNVRDQ
jgi:glycosyltransferase involved in cell wall biosynthesis